MRPLWSPIARACLSIKLWGASLTIRILDLSSGKRSMKLSENHTSKISQMAFSAGGTYLASACSQARFVNIFRCTKGSESLLRTLTLVQPPTYLAIQSGPVAGSAFVTVAACSDRGLTVFRLSPDEEGSGNVRLCVRMCTILLVAHLSSRVARC